MKTISRRFIGDIPIKPPPTSWLRGASMKYRTDSTQPTADPLLEIPIAAEDAFDSRDEWTLDRAPRDAMMEAAGAVKRRKGASVQREANVFGFRRQSEVMAHPVASRNRQLQSGGTADQVGWVALNEMTVRGATSS